MIDKNKQAFFALLRAGLWETESLLTQYGEVDWNVIYQLAVDQCVTGLVAAGIEHVPDVKVSHEVAMTFVDNVLQLEQCNQTMNEFIALLIKKLRKAGVYALLVKGQGIAQCYERPLWRACGDVDLLLNEDNYKKAKKLLMPLATDVETEYSHFKHLGMTIDGWVVELHGTLHSRLSRRVDNGIDAVQDDVFRSGNVRVWNNSGTQVFMPAPDCDAIFLFTHILHHYFFEGIGLRQFCDLCRFLWTYRGELDVALLEKRLHEMRLMTEWKTFAAFAVDYLGMPEEVMPLFSADKKWKKKGEKMCRFVMKVGNFGFKNRRDLSGMSYATRKFISFWGRLSDMLRHISVFPLDSVRFFGGVLRSGMHAAIRGE